MIRCFFIVTVFAFAMVFAGVPSSFAVHHEERVDHYEGHTISTKEGALQALAEGQEKIKGFLAKDELDVTEMEDIHELSYTLEAAVDKLIALKSFSEAELSALDEAVQAVHYASENHEEEKLREWSEKLSEATAALGRKDKSVKHEKKTTYEIFIKDHKFTPEELYVPAGQKIKLIVHNQDPTPEEFESDDFRREKIIAGNSKATIHVGPLKPGKYHFFGEFNLKTANGYLYAE